METKKVGINKIKEILTAIAVIVIAIDLAMEDKKISPLEWVKIALKGLGLLKVAKIIKGAKAELMDLDGAEKQEIELHFNAKFDLRNDALEATVESVVALAIRMSDNLSLLAGVRLKKSK